MNTFYIETENTVELKYGMIYSFILLSSRKCSFWIVWIVTILNCVTCVCTKHLPSTLLFPLFFLSAEDRSKHAAVHSGQLSLFPIPEPGGASLHHAPHRHLSVCVWQQLVANLQRGRDSIFQSTSHQTSSFGTYVSSRCDMVEKNPEKHITEKRT